MEIIDLRRPQDQYNAKVTYQQNRLDKPFNPGANIFSRLVPPSSVQEVPVCDRKYSGTQTRRKTGLPTPESCPQEKDIDPWTALDFV